MDDVIIVGAGIGGLTLGLALHAARIPCRIFESAAEIKAIGVGINLLPHATKELAALGLEAELARVAIATTGCDLLQSLRPVDLSGAAGPAPRATSIRSSRSIAATCRWCCSTRSARAQAAIG